MRNARGNWSLKRNKPRVRRRIAGTQERPSMRTERLLDLHRKLPAANIPADKKLYQRQIEATDEEIDALVYELYGLTEEETAIVEGSKVPNR